MSAVEECAPVPSSSPRIGQEDEDVAFLGLRSEYGALAPNHRYLKGHRPQTTPPEKTYRLRRQRTPPLAERMLCSALTVSSTEGAITAAGWKRFLAVKVVDDGGVRCFDLVVARR
ncbi:MAG: hypothetical protein V2A76_07500 [Planctomycetota bacterium]